MATSNKIHRIRDVDVEALLPWYAAGTLGPRDTRGLIVALARDPKLAKQYAAVRQEYAQTLRFNESLGAPSPRVLQKLFAAIDAESGEPPDAALERKRSSSSRAYAS